jgi:uncharacterized protein (TIGR02246 family)
MIGGFRPAISRHWLVAPDHVNTIAGCQASVSFYEALGLLSSDVAFVSANTERLQGKQMNRFKNAALFAASMIALAACAQSAPPATNRAADEAAIRAADAAWFKAEGAGDADGKAVLYAEDAVWSAPGAPAVRGHVAILEHFKKDAADMTAAGLVSKIGPTTDVGVSGDLGWAFGTYTVTDKSGATVEAGKYLTVLQRKDGKWQIIQDMYNSDAVPAAPAAPTPAATAPAPGKKAK